MKRETKNLYAFGPFRFDAQQRLLERDGEPTPLSPKLVELLFALVENAGQLIEKDDLMKRVWPDTYVEEGNLNKNISTLRKALGQWDGGREYIETVPKRGYRFSAVVTQVAIGTEAQTQAPADLNPIRTRTYSYRIIGVSVLVAAAAFTIAKLTSPPVGRARVSFVQLTSDGHAKVGALRTDGSRVYMTEYLPETGKLLVQVSAKGGETVALSTSLKEPREVDLSRDGTELLLMDDETAGPHSLWIQAVAGGAPRRVGDLLVNNASWGPDEDAIVYSKGKDIYVARVDGTLSRKLLTVPGFPSDLKFSPDGKKLRFTLADNEDRTTALWEASADGSKPHPLLPGWNTPASECCGSWTADNKYFVFESTQNGRTDIWELKEKDGFLQGADGKPEQLTDGPLNFFDPISSKDRRELFAIGVLPRAELVRYDLLTHQFSPYLSGISVEGVDFSRDGAWVTYVSYPEGTLWRSRVDGSDRLQLTFQSMRVLLPRWSPDGKQIAFMGSPPSSPWKLGGPWKIYLVPAQGGTPRQLQPGELNEADPTWSPDGNSIAFGRLPGPGNSAVNSAALDIQVIDLKTGKLSKLLGSDGLFSPRWSPDGRYVVAFTASHPTAPKLFDFATLKWTQLASTEMGYPSWSHDGKFIYMQDWNRGRPRIVRLRLRDRKLEVIMDFAQVERNMAGTIIPWSGVALDGSPLLARDISNSEIYRLSLRAR